MLGLLGMTLQFTSDKDFTVSPQPPMQSARADHAALYHSQYVYVMGGSNTSECERFVCEESRWEELPALPVGGEFMNLVELENSIYALGGKDNQALDTVQQLSLDSLTWEVLQLKLPAKAHWFPCLKSNTQVFMVIDKTLYSFTPLEIRPIKTVPKNIMCLSSYFSRGTLYHEDLITVFDSIYSLELGELTSQ
jgi:hypothetical protein